MHIRIIINTMEMADHGLNKITKRTAEVWRGDLDILPHEEYLTKISIIADGVEHPICDVPFSIAEGYWKWFNGETSSEDTEQLTE